MIVFINDRPIRLVGPKATSQLTNSLKREAFSDYDKIVDARLDILKEDALQGHLLVLNTTPATIEKLVHLLQKAKATGLSSITLGCLDKSACEDAIKKPFKIIKAAGGIVFKGDKMLLMFRRGVWDLPKGKLDDGESSRQGAAREVEEETGVRVTVGDRVCTTWHTYNLNGNRILKRTKWYRMSVVDDRRMTPQADEGIEKLAWFDQKQTKLALTNSFSSIRYVIDSVNELIKQ
ncbi:MULTISPECIES: NUDIX hydrolase [Spirosoma]|uniref:NUDIX domain-containing protein n=1 Tax=Spirosoma liriopis TaxID=2937440 RepID=A0ABT0HPJ3_9BACT|nr:MULTISPECIES: NUDIX domain-containing protein [Spirosoma]MCK8494102.1 NUDIX domain-containing protein [Spirosoma liriopis]UHG89119.1 NUDIX domain-containing protein [Spirosoma oryzicola]